MTSLYLKLMRRALSFATTLARRGNDATPFMEVQLRAIVRSTACDASNARFFNPRRKQPNRFEFEQRFTLSEITCIFSRLANRFDIGGISSKLKGEHSFDDFGRQLLKPKPSSQALASTYRSTASLLGGTNRKWVFRKLGTFSELRPVVSGESRVR